MPYTIFEHTADLGLSVDAGSLDELFADAARGLTEVLTGDSRQIRARVARSFVLTGRDHSELLAEWLSELLFVFDTERLLFREFEVHVRDEGLVATACGEVFDSTVHRLAHEIKAVTRHLLEVREVAGRWTATLVLDI